MQRWFFLEETGNTRIRKGLGDENAEEDSSRVSVKFKKWTFRVRVPDILPGETVCISGSDNSLGKWLPEKCEPLVQETYGDQEIWSQSLNISDHIDVQYRYCICMMVEPTEQVIVRKWETFLIPRKVRKGEEQGSVMGDAEFFGEFEGYTKIERGWLTKESVVQFKLYNNPLTLFRPKFASRTVYIKVTPVNLIRHTSDRPTSMAEALEESLSTDTQDVGEPPKFAHTVVASLTSSSCVFEPQGQFGKEYNPNDILIYETTVLDMKNIAFLVDIYIYSSHSVSGDPPYHVGFSYLLPSVFKTSEDHIVLAVTSTKHRPMGQIELDYLVIKPLERTKCDLKVSYARHWNKSRKGLDVGHRGLGTSFKVETKNCAEVRENTIASLKTAASHGADFVEFDVQLSKDLVPIIYHDFHVCISMKRKKELNHSDMLELPVKELNLEQLHLLKVYHLTEGKSKNPRFFDEDLEEHQPFPTLQQVLEIMEPHVGFNVEIKRSNELNDGSHELDHSLDVNVYLDTILDIVLKYGGERRIIFSCFNPDVCRMVRLKQNRYPVMFLTQGQTARYPVFRDPRCQTISGAVQCAICSEILGVNVHTEDLLRDASQVRLATEAGLVIFCWGDDNNDPNTIKFLKELGLHGVIYDKIDQYSNKEVKESIFLVEARESQRQLILVAAANSESQPATTTQMMAPVPERSLDVERACQNMRVMSTATSLESLESNNSVENERFPPQRL